MSEKQKQPETYILINDTSQRSVAVCFASGGTLTITSLQSVFKRIFEIAQHLAKLWGNS